MATPQPDIGQLQTLCDRLQKEIDSLKAQLGSLLEITGLVSTAQDDPQPVFDKVLERALALTGAGAGSLMVKEDDALRIVAFRGLDAEAARRSRPRLGEGIAGWVAEHGQPLLLIAGADKSKPFPLERPIKDALSVPLRVGDTTVGVLNVNNSPVGRKFGLPDLELLRAFAGQAALALRMLRTRQETEKAYLSVIQALAEAIDAKDPYTAGHSRRVSDYAVRLAQQLDLDEDQVKQIGLAALLHDIGKIGISEDILRQPLRLDQPEYGLIRTHPVISAKILEPVPSLKEAVPIIRHHHERYDGRGYPAGLRGEEIPLGARVLAVVDAFDAMASGRTYRAVMKLETVLDELKQQRGRQFDPRAIDAFVRAVEAGEMPLGAAVVTGREVRRPPMSSQEIENFLATEPEIALDIMEQTTRQLLERLESIAGRPLTDKVGRALAVPPVSAASPYRRHQDCRRHFRRVREHLDRIVGVRLTERLLVEAATGLDETGRRVALTILKEIGIEPPQEPGV